MALELEKIWKGYLAGIEVELTIDIVLLNYDSCNNGKLYKRGARGKILTKKACLCVGNKCSCLRDIEEGYAIMKYWTLRCGPLVKIEDSTHLIRTQAFPPEILKIVDPKLRKCDN